MHQLDSASPLHFDLDVRTQDAAADVVLRGELDLATVDAVRHRVMALWDAGYRAVRVDLRDLSFMDPSGVHLLLGLQRTAEATGRELAILEGDGPARNVLLLSGVRSRLSLAEG